MKSTEPILPSNRNFGLFFAAIFLITAFFAYRISESSWVFIFIAISLGFFATALMSPNSLLPLNKLWMKFGLLLSAIVSPIVMGLIFFGVFTPISIIMKVVGRDELCLQFKKENTHWKSPIMPKAKSYFFDQF